MTGYELLKELQELSEDELNCPVYVYADHGQSPMQQNFVSVLHCTSYEYDLEDSVICSEELQDYLDSGQEVKKFIEIS